MASEEMRKYINATLSSTVLVEMPNLAKKHHGIPHVVIWVGKTNNQHWLRVKVSKLKDEASRKESDWFVIQIPSLDYDHTQVPSWITAKTMKKIMEWIKLNQDAIYDFERNPNANSNELINKISKV